MFNHSFIEIKINSFKLSILKLFVFIFFILSQEYKVQVWIYIFIGSCSMWYFKLIERLYFLVAFYNVLLYFIFVFIFLIMIGFDSYFAFNSYFDHVDWSDCFQNCRKEICFILKRKTENHDFICEFWKNNNLHLGEYISFFCKEARLRTWEN